MVIDFAALNLKERPILILKNLDGTYIQPLAYAHDIEAKIYYNETSELSFELPAYVDGNKTPHYDDVVGMRIIDWLGVGQFILMNPKVKDEGIKAVKSCIAYSLEYELTYKKTFIEEGTYAFYDPVSPDNTVLGMLMKDVPSWSVGSVDANLIGKYRTFEVDNTSVYDFMKNTLQETYQCIFDFDTYSRKVNVRAVTSLVDTKPVYLSVRNLIKEIELEEDTENIFTCLDVSGAEDVDIRSVNPMGTNKIYNLDYFMNTSYFTEEMISKWESWKTTLQNNQELYFSTTVEKVIQESRYVAENAKLTRLRGELSELETMQSVYVEAEAAGEDMSSELKDIRKQISDKDTEIDDQEMLVDEILEEIADLQNQQTEINAACAFESFFTKDEMDILDRYIKEDAIAEESFVYKTVSSYTEDDVANVTSTFAVSFTDSSVTRVKSANGNEIYMIVGGKMTLSGESANVSADVVRATIERKTDGTYVLTAYLNSGKFDDTEFPSGCVAVTGTVATLETDVVANESIEGEYKEGTEVSLASGESNLYFTINATEYAKRSVEWDLLEYGQQCLEELCWPSYTFKIDSANFLAMDDFDAFRKQFALGSKVYLDLGEEKILTPIAVGVEFSPDDPTDFTLLFGDKYSLKDSAFQLVDLLEQSISMGKTTATNRTNYNSFIDSGAGAALYDYINSALDAAKQMVTAGQNQAITIGESGIRLRKWNDAAQDYEDEQVWMINNQIVFTDDNWSSAKLALGHIVDPDEDIDAWGLVAEQVYGKLLAGNNLIIEGMQQDGTKVAFRLDSSGAQLHNAAFDLIKDNGYVTLYPDIGLVGGKSTTSAPLFAYDTNGNPVGVYTNGGTIMNDLTTLNAKDLPRAAFWLDMEGNAYFKGTVFADSGVFRGTVYAEDGEFGGTLKAATGSFSGTVNATDGSFSGTVNAKDLMLNGISVSDIMTAVPDNSGNLDYLQIGDITIDGTTGAITFAGGTDVVMVQYSTTGTGGWRDTWDSSWTDTVVYARYSYDGGSTWTPSIQIQSKNGEDGQDGKDGSDGSDADVPEYIRSTYIDFSRVETPTLIANAVQTLGTFQVGRGSRTNFNALGYIGSAYGEDAEGERTYGIAITDSGTYNETTNYVTYENNSNYLIVTNGGVRMQAGTNRITVTDSSINITTGSGKAYYNGDELNTGGGSTATIKAVWG